MLPSLRDRDSPSPWRQRGGLLASLLIGLLCGWQISMRSCMDNLPRGTDVGPRSPSSSPLSLLDPAVHSQGNLVRLPAPLRAKSLTHLVMIAGHGVHLGADFTTLRTNDAAWSLEPYQRSNGQTEAFVKHIERAVQITGEDPRALLIFSGGETRAVSTTAQRILSLSPSGARSHPCSLDWLFHFLVLRVQALSTSPRPIGSSQSV